MAKVDPYISRIPRSFLEDPDTRSWAIYLNRFLHDMWIRTGGGEDLVGESSEATTALDDGISTMILPDDFEARSITSDYTANDYDFINATRAVTIKLPKYPKPRSRVIIRNGDGTLIKLNGNGRTLNGERSGSLRRKGTSITFHYFIETNEWFAR